MDAFVNYWVPILMMLISVGAAIWANYSSSKECSKKISAIEKSTEKQIESIKELERIQAEIATIQLDKELWEMNLRWLQNSKQIGDVIDDQHSFITQFSDVAFSKTYELNRKEKNLEYEQEFYDKYRERLKYYIKRVEEIKKKLNLK